MAFGNKRTGGKNLQKKMHYNEQLFTDISRNIYLRMSPYWTSLLLEVDCLSNPIQKNKNIDWQIV